MTTGRRLNRNLTAIGVAIIAIIVNVPFLGAILASLKTTGNITSSPLGVPIPPTPEHYQNVLYAAGYDFQSFFRNSIIISGATVILVVGISMPAAYAIVRLKLGGRWLLNMIAALRLLPAIFFVLPLFVMFSELGLLDTRWGMIIVDSFLNIPIAMVILARGVSEVPVELEEAAMVDGASPYRTLRSIVMPLMAPTMVAAAVITFLFTWNDYVFAVIMTTTNARTLTVGASQFVTSFGILWGDISAAVVLSVMIPVAFAIFAQRHLVSGLSSGAINK